MAPVIRLASYRARPERSVVLEAPAGDSDLRAITLVLWIGSAIRVALELRAGRAFGTEASLALMCVFGLPWLAIHSRNNAAAVSRRALSKRIRKA